MTLYGRLITQPILQESGAPLASRFCRSQLFALTPTPGSPNSEAESRRALMTNTRPFTSAETVAESLADVLWINAMKLVSELRQNGGRARDEARLLTDLRPRRP